MLLPSLVALDAESHELDVDELRLWLPPTQHELRGQLSFDPELTRPLDAELSDDEKRQRVVGFVERNLSVRVNGSPCSLEVTVRELYERGGAVPGDLVGLACPLTPPHAPNSEHDSQGQPETGLERNIEVTVGRDFQALRVEVAGGTGPAETKVLTAGGTTSVFRQSVPLPGVQRAKDPQSAAPPPARQTSSRRGLLAVARSFFRVGIGHVLPGGLDHLLFVAALTLGAHQRLRHVLSLVLTFTLAHTLATLGAALGAWTPPAAVVEPCIAGSIALAGLAVYFQVPPYRSLFAVFGFGLIHGLGFASALGSPSGSVGVFLTSMFAFNLGVEVAQLGVVLALWGLVAGVRRTNLETEKWVSTAGIVIAGVGVGWTLLRLVAAFHAQT